MQNPYNMAAPDLPPALASILNVGSPSAPAAPPSAGLSGSMGGQPTFAPSYEVGGMIGAGGMPDMAGMGAGLAPQGQMPQGAMSPQMLEMQVNQFATQHPQQIAQIRQSIQEVMATGELTQQ